MSEPAPCMSSVWFAYLLLHRLHQAPKLGQEFIHCFHALFNDAWKYRYQSADTIIDILLPHRSTTDTVIDITFTLSWWNTRGICFVLFWSELPILKVHPFPLSLIGEIANMVQKSYKIQWFARRGIECACKQIKSFSLFLSLIYRISYVSFSLILSLIYRTRDLQFY